ncbi:MAG: winged helix-turn-helix transcriptional regulator, partial [Burkholderiaceae bacterium]
ADVYAGTRQEYRLTPAGLALFPITLELMRWGNQWLLAPEQALRLRHLPCGQPLQARWHCGHCQQPLTRQGVRFT